MTHFSHRYYNANSVCMPKLFAGFDDTFQPMSMALVIINFLSFAYILFTYTKIYTSSRRANELSQGRARNTGSK